MNEERNKTIIKTSIVGIIVNVLLAAVKAVIGLIAGSIAIVLDAVNNISDAGSSIITIVGTKLAAKPADRKHPFGYGRIEYISAMIISVIVLYAGITSLVESVKKIIHPETAEYTTPGLIIIAVAVVVKILLGAYFKKVGKSVNSDSLVNSGEDATLDSVISAATLVAAVIFLIWHVSIEAWLAAVISVVIIKSGIEMLSETLSRILGERADSATVIGVKKLITGYPQVHGAYDLILHNYGPDNYNGSVHVEVDDTLTADEIDTLTRDITNKVYKETGVILTAISVYSRNTGRDASSAMRDAVYAIAKEEQYVLGTHGFYLDETAREIRFDLVVSFDAPDRRAVTEAVAEKIKGAYPGYTPYINIDFDFSET